MKMVDILNKSTPVTGQRFPSTDILDTIRPLCLNLFIYACISYCWDL